MVAEARQTNSNARAQAATLEKSDVANDNHESQGACESWTDTYRFFLCYHLTVLPVPVKNDVSPDVPRRVEDKDQQRDQKEPAIFPSDLLDLHDLIHVVDKVQCVDQHTAQEPCFVVTAVSLISVDYQVQR